MAGDANYYRRSLLLHGKGPNNSQVFTDSSLFPKALTAIGDVKISTAQPGFSTSSLFFDGSGDAITTPNAGDWDFGTGDFTIEMRVYPTNLTASKFRGLLVHDSIGGTRGWLLVIEDGLDGTVRGRPNFSAWSGSTLATVLGAGPLTVDVKTHLAVTRKDGVFRLFVDGTLVATNSANTTLSIGNPTTPLCIGSLYEVSGISQEFAGYMQEVSVIKGYAQYTESFTPSAAPYLDYSGQVAGIVRDEAGAPCARAVRAYRRDTGALVGAVTSDAGTGAYTINCPTFGEVSRVVLDDAGGVQYNDLIDRVIPA